MQKLIETLKEFGLSVPAEKESEIKAALAKNYKNVAEHDKTVSKIENERNAWKERAETAETTLKSFDGIDPAKVNDEIAKWKKKAEDAETEYNSKMAEHEKSELLKSAFEGIKFTSESAKKAIWAQISEGVTVKNGKLIGFNDLLDDAKKNDASAFVNEQQEEMEGKKARFASSQNNGGASSGVVTAKEIMAIKDPVERQRKMAENIDLFKK